MKKMYLLLFVTAGIFKIAHAQNQQDLQFKKGDKLLGGSVAFTHSDASGIPNTSSSLYVSPSLGLFTKPNRLTGFSLIFNSNLNAQHTFGAAVYKQYWNNLGKNSYFIMQGQLAASYQTSKSGNRNNPNTGQQHAENYSLSAGISPGFAYRLNRKLVIDAFLADFLYVSDTYGNLTTTFPNGNEIKSHNNAINLSSGISGFNLGSVRVGFRFVL